MRGGAGGRMTFLGRELIFGKGREPQPWCLQKGEGSPPQDAAAVRQGGAGRVCVSAGEVWQRRVPGVVEGGGASRGARGGRRSRSTGSGGYDVLGVTWRASWWSTGRVNKPGSCEQTRGL